MERKSTGREEEYLKKHKYNVRVKLKSGTFLHVYCPRCSVNLIEDNMIHIVAVNQDGTEGVLKLSPYLNVFDHKETMNIQPATELKDMTCPHCKQSIVEENVRCEKCGSHTAEFSVAAVQIRVPFLICLKEGCHWHGVTPEDEQLLIQDACDEW